MPPAIHSFRSFRHRPLEQGQVSLVLPAQVALVTDMNETRRATARCQIVGGTNRLDTWPDLLVDPPGESDARIAPEQPRLEVRRKSVSWLEAHQEGGHSGARND